MTQAATGFSVLHVARVLVFGSAALCLGIAVAGAIGRPRQESVPAWVTARVLEVSAARDCRLMEVFVNCGQTVTEGDPLLRFVDDRLDALALSKVREVAEAEVELRRTQAAADVELAWRRRELEREVYQTQLDSARLQQERVTRQVEQIAWKEHLGELDSWAGGETSELLLQPVTLSSRRPDSNRLQALLKEDAAASAAEVLQHQLALTEQRKKELGTLTQDLEQKVRVSTGVEVAEARLERAKAELTAVQEQQAALTVRSGTFGTVGLWRKHPGDRVTAGEVVVELIDDAQVTAVAQVPSSRIHQFEAGQRLNLEFPGQELRHGTVAVVPPQVDRRASPGDTSETMLPVTLAPAGKLWPKLPSGTQVRVLIP